MSEILASIDNASLLFLAKTAIFNGFTATMAIDLTGYSNAQNFLDQLINDNFLIDRTGETEPVFSYHPILRNLLKKRTKDLLTDEQLNQLNRRAIDILISQNKIEEALPFYIQMHDWQGLKPLIIKHSESLIMGLC